MPNLAIVSINKDKYSETFIHNHVRLLPAHVHFLYGGYLPVYYGEGHSFLREEDLKGNDKALLSEQVKHYLLQNNIDAVLAEYGPSGVEMMGICKEAGIPLIVHFHGYDAYREDMLRTYGDRYPELFENATAIIVVSNHMKEHLVTMGAPESKITKTVCGADESLFQYADAGKNPPTILSVGRFDETKGQHLSILAFNKVFKKNNQTRMVMVGDGHLLESCKILVKAFNLEDQISFKGSLAQQEIAYLMKQARVLIQHSVTTSENDREGTPVAILEAALSGLPVVSTFHGGIPDVIVDGENGFLVNEGDIDATVEAVLKLLNNPDLATGMGYANCQKVKENFTLNKHIDEVWSVILSCIEQPAN